MKIFPAIVIFCLLSCICSAQHINQKDIRTLHIAENNLKTPAIEILQGTRTQDRLKADSLFTRGFVQSLKTNNSFYYPFDSLVTISKLYSPDSLFRIFTWQLVIDEADTRQHGAIQMRTSDGSLKLFPLIDKSDVTSDYPDSIGDNYGWMGAVYYKIILTTAGDKRFYTLLGFDECSLMSSRKVIEVLSFVDNKPIFGGHYFSTPNDKLFAKNPARYVMEFKKDAGPRLTYDEDMRMIVMEHLVSESNEPNKKFTLIGDGDYEGFKWMNGKWIYVNKVFNQVTPEGQPPVPTPLQDDHGVIKQDETEPPAPAATTGKHPAKKKG